MDLRDPTLFQNRELSWLTFNERVLTEAGDSTLPLFERLKFLGITSTNLDEFFMVRVAGLKQQVASGVVEPTIDGMVASEQLSAISDRVHGISTEQSRIFRDELLPMLGERGLLLPKFEDLTAAQKNAARTYFTRAVFPALTPLAVDPGHPFPHLRNKSLNLAVFLRKSHNRRKKKGERLLAVVQVPSVLSRLVPLPSSSGRAFLLLEWLISAHVGDLFPGYEVQQTTSFRVTRNWDLELDEEESQDLLSTVQEELRRRDRGAAVRLQLENNASAEMESTLVAALKLSSSADVYRVDGPLQLADLNELSQWNQAAELRFEPHLPAVPYELRDIDSVFSQVGKRDILLHHPYESFDPVVRFLYEAADDPDVLAIKQTLYRTSGDSPFVRALARAAENGKQVTVLIEIKARFDEANNIAWARRLEQSGVHVVYGIIGLKTHCKVALVVRREGEAIRRYVHLGTGNYNSQTARLYTDLSLFTSRKEIAEDASALFNLLTGFAEPPKWRRLVVAPFSLQEGVIERIEKQTQAAKKGQPARIIAKMNSLACPKVIRALYAASRAGVRIQLVVRGISCLRPGIPGVSENIEVRSIVGRFLEHSRVFAFGVGDKTEVFLSSADWMPRNFHRRIEVMFPVDEPLLRRRILNDVIGFALKDTAKARVLQTDGSVARPAGSDEAFSSQTQFIEEAKNAAKRRVAELRPAAAPEISAIEGHGSAAS